MRLFRFRHSFFGYALIVTQISFFSSCSTESSKNKVEKVGFLGFYLDMEYLKVKNMRDSLVKLGELNYFETTDELGSKQTNLYYVFSGISPVLCAKVNLRGTYIIDQRLNSIQLTLGSKKDNGELRISYKCAMTELNKLFESYEERYGKPTLLEQGEKYEWLSKRISNVYLPGPKGRLAMDKMYFWEKGNYIIYFDFGYPENMVSSASSVREPVLPDSTGAPIIYYDFTQDYIDKLLEMAGGEKRR